MLIYNALYLFCRCENCFYCNSHITKKCFQNIWQLSFLILFEKFTIKWSNLDQIVKMVKFELRLKIVKILLDTHELQLKSIYNLLTALLRFLSLTQYMHIYTTYRMLNAFRYLVQCSNYAPRDEKIVVPLIA